MEVEELEIVSNSDMSAEITKPGRRIENEGSNESYSPVSSINSSPFRSFKRPLTSARPNKDEPRKGMTSLKEMDEYTSKLQTICKDARFFLMKSNNKENVLISKSQGVWSTLSKNEFKLNKAFETSPNVILIFSVNQSRTFNGFARLASKSQTTSQINWSMPAHVTSRIGGVFKVDWISKKTLDFSEAHHLKNPWNFGKPVKVGRDAQEIKPSVGFKLCRLFKMDADSDLPGILKKSKEAHEKFRSSAATKPIGVICRRSIGPYFPSSKPPRYHCGGHAYSYGDKSTNRPGCSCLNSIYTPAGHPRKPTDYNYRYPAPPPAQPLTLTRYYVGPGMPMLRVSRQYPYRRY